jgi:hypothetical protein
MLILLVACVGNPVITPETEGCVDYDFNGPNKSEIVVNVSDGVADVYRSYVERDNLDDAFEPDIEAEGGLIKVYERWKKGSDGNATCLDPHLIIEEFGAPIEVRWYAPDDMNIPFDTVTVSPG